MRAFDLISCQITDAIFRVTHYENGNAEGNLLHARLERPQKICSIPQLLVTLEDVLTREDSPVRRQTLIRPEERDETIAVFRIQVLFREHYTWQGRLVWEDRQMEVPFHSVLELILIMDEILSK